MALDSMQEIFDKSEQGQKPFWRVILDTDMEEREVSEEGSLERMRFTWKAMLESVEKYQGDRRSVSGLVGGDGKRMREYAASHEMLSGSYIQEVIATALSVGESNACMCKLVAAPTAGACGVLPAVLVPLYQTGAFAEEEILKALYVASGIGAVIAFRACIAGAAGGCQAEIGSASAMAAGALAWCATLWQVWWRSPASSVTWWVLSTPLPAPIWPWLAWKARSPWTRSSTAWAMWAAVCRWSSARPLWAAWL